ASHYNYKGSGVLTRKAINSLTAFMVGNIGHRTGVDNANVSSLALLNGFYTLPFQLVAEGRSFCKIKLA
ncbi:hypothetical protein RFZ44_28340, partial [Acinetobacter sp. 163]|nr:hypothetical protein [Acinetobacter sp. 163]